MGYFAWNEIQSFASLGCHVVIDDFVVVLDLNEFENGRIAREYGVRSVCGGATHNWSLENALDYIAEKWPAC